MKKVLLLALFLIASPAYADVHFTTDPFEEEMPSPLHAVVTIDDFTEGDGIAPLETGYWNIGVSNSNTEGVGNGDPIVEYYSEECYAYNDSQSKEFNIYMPNGYEVSSVFIVGGYLEADCSDVPDEFYVDWYYDEGVPKLFTVAGGVYPAPDGPEDEDGPVFDFMGSTTPMDVFNSVKDGVQETGKSAWPLFTIMGVPLTFWVGRALVGLVKVV